MRAQVLGGFALSYLAYLDGGPVSRLRYASITAASQVKDGGRIPPAFRDGALRITSSRRAGVRRALGAGDGRGRQPLGVLPVHGADALRAERLADRSDPSGRPQHRRPHPPARRRDRPSRWHRPRPAVRGRIRQLPRRRYPNATAIASDAAQSIAQEHRPARADPDAAWPGGACVDQLRTAVGAANSRPPRR